MLLVCVAACVVGMKGVWPCRWLVVNKCNGREGLEGKCFVQGLAKRSCFDQLVM